MTRMEEFKHDADVAIEQVEKLCTTLRETAAVTFDMESRNELAFRKYDERGPDALPGATDEIRNIIQHALDVAGEIKLLVEEIENGDYSPFGAESKQEREARLRIFDQATNAVKEES